MESSSSIARSQVYWLQVLLCDLDLFPKSLEKIEQISISNFVFYLNIFMSFMS